MMPKTQEQRNALISTARRCNEELKAAMNQKPKPKFDAVSRPLLKKHFEKLKALGIPFTLFIWTIGVMNKQFKEY